MSIYLIVHDYGSYANPEDVSLMQPYLVLKNTKHHVTFHDDDYCERIWNKNIFKWEIISDIELPLLRALFL